jgi:DNA-binding MarR family transcriptional regulator
MTEVEQDADKFANTPGLSLLNAAGRVLVVVVEYPQGITLSDIANRLNVTNTAVAKAISSLVEAQIVARTKVNSRDLYLLNPKGLWRHPDIISLARLADLAAVGDSE